MVSSREPMDIDDSLDADDLDEIEDELDLSEDQLLPKPDGEKRISARAKLEILQERKALNDAIKDSF